MQNILVTIHSFVDIITNSSTELFVLDTDKSVEFVKEILQEAINLHNKADNTNLKFKDIFEEPYIGSGKGELYGHGYSDCYSSKINEGIIITGAEDNSIPYWMFEFIESIFGYSTERFHLG